MKLNPDSGVIIYSPSDLMVFTRSPFGSWMDRAALHDPSLLSDRDPEDPLLKILARQGNEHEARHLAEIQSSGRDVVVLSRQSTCDDASQVIASRAEIIYQPRLCKGQFEGFADFLKLSNDAEPSYEVWDTKLSRHVKPEYLIQLCAYADMVEAMTEVRPRTVGLILGDGREVRFHVPEYFDYYCYKRDEFLAFMNECAQGRACPEPAVGADHGHWSGLVKKRRVEDDHLVQVANITRRQIGCLEAGGIGTLEALAETDISRVAGIDDERYRRLRRQAVLQKATRDARMQDPRALPAWELLEPSECRPGLGFAALPDPVAEGDVYFDIEGDPLRDPRLEYLLGVSYVENGQQQYRAFWAHSFAEERESFSAFMGWIADRRRRYPNMHIYHYAAYENGALKELASRHDMLLEEVDDLLRDDVLVDLFSVVRNALRIGEPNYSLKSVEHLYLAPREGEVTTAGDSVVQYDYYRQLCEAGDDECQRKAAALLREIEDYNKVDCDSTLALANWLRAHRPASVDTPDAEPVNEQRDAPDDEQEPSARQILEANLREAAQALRERAATSGDQVCVVLADVLNFHERERKPRWWRYFELKAADPDELVDAGDAIVGARFQSSRSIARSQGLTFTFDPGQELEMRSGDSVEVVEWQDTEGWAAAGKIVELDKGGRIEIKISNARLAARVDPDQLPSVTIILKPQEYPERRFQERLLSLAEDVLADRRLPPALTHFICRAEPPVSNITPDVVTEQGINPKEIARRLAAETGFSLCVQGPPGTGKTHSFARVAAELVAAGKKVGVVAGSHEVVRNFVRAVGEAGDELGWRFGEFPLFCQFKGYDRGELEDAVPCAHPFHWDDWHDNVRFVAGTHFFFAREDAACEFDYLFIDEAGQFALANLVGLSAVARSLVLIGDPQQLPQVVQGGHPGRGGQSCLQYALAGKDVLDDAQGLFLPITYRLRPEICAFVSDISYESRLCPAEGNSGRWIKGGDRLPNPNGIVWLAVEHDGNSQESAEEASFIADLTTGLLEARFIDGSEERPLSIDDFLYVSPYNMQVARLRETLPDGARVGSVNLFQGQQAPVVFVSLCASPGEPGPRGLSFILDRNRMNVAISRAQCLAIVVGHPGLLSSDARNTEDIRQMNTLARLMRLHSSGATVQPVANVV
ncbi:MAG TPA: TM0106 family RecB-like putative nuclease [Gammaproteobacteria bacterium]|nr:TM0106 family RecB-like putative nuclease [Gammaproteobacteria bacterium]